VKGKAKRRRAQTQSERNQTKRDSLKYYNLVAKALKYGANNSVDTDKGVLYHYYYCKC